MATKPSTARPLPSIDVEEDSKPQRKSWKSVRDACCSVRGKTFWFFVILWAVLIIFIFANAYGFPHIFEPTEELLSHNRVRSFIYVVGAEEKKMEVCHFSLSLSLPRSPLPKRLTTHNPVCENNKKHQVQYWSYAVWDEMAEAVDAMAAGDSSAFVDLISEEGGIGSDWQYTTFGNVLAVYNASGSLLWGEYHPYVNASVPADPANVTLPTTLMGTTSESRTFLRRLFAQNETNGVMAMPRARSNSTGGGGGGNGSGRPASTEDVFLYTSYAVRANESDATVHGYFVVLKDIKPVLQHATKKDNVCLGYWTSQVNLPTEFARIAGDLVPITAARYTTYAAMDGDSRLEYLRLLTNPYEAPEHQVCGPAATVDLTRTHVGQTYFELRSTLAVLSSKPADDEGEGPNGGGGGNGGSGSRGEGRDGPGDKTKDADVALYVRLDHDLPVRNRGRLQINILLGVLALVVLGFTVIMVLVLEFGVLRKLDRLRAFLRGMVAERQKMLSDAFAFNEYYNYGAGDEARRVFEEALANAVNSRDQFSALSAMADSYQRWMRGLVDKKVAAVNELRAAAQREAATLRLLNLWNWRGEAELAPSYVSLRDTAPADARAPTLAAVLDSPVALEFFKAYCVRQGVFHNVSFVLDVTWLRLLENEHDRARQDGRAAEAKDAKAAAVRLYDAVIQRYFAHGVPSSSPAAAATAPAGPSSSAAGGGGGDAGHGVLTASGGGGGAAGVGSASGTRKVSSDAGSAATAATTATAAGGGKGKGRCALALSDATARRIVALHRKGGYRAGALRRAALEVSQRLEKDVMPGFRASSAGKCMLLALALEARKREDAARARVLRETGPEATPAAGSSAGGTAPQPKSAHRTDMFLDMELEVVGKDEIARMVKQENAYRKLAAASRRTGAARDRTARAKQGDALPVWRSTPGSSAACSATDSSFSAGAGAACSAADAPARDTLSGTASNPSLSPPPQRRPAAQSAAGGSAATATTASSTNKGGKN